MSAKTQSSSGGIGFLGLLAILFIGLKLTGYISWSWWWVTAPLWGGLVVGLAILLVALVGLGIMALVAIGLDWWAARKRKKRVTPR